MEWVRYQEQANFIQNDFNGKVIEPRIEALKNYQKPNDLKLSLYIQQNFEPKQAFLNLPGSRDKSGDQDKELKNQAIAQGTMDTAAMSRATTGKSESNVKITLVFEIISRA
eukprot:bmy_07896T0